MRSGQVMTHDYSHQSMKEDSRMMAFFDSLVQREIEGLTSDSSLSGGNSDSWLFNVAESVSFSDVVPSSEDSSDDDLSASVSRDVGDPLNSISSPGASRVPRSNSLNLVLENATGSQTSLSLDSSSHEEPDSAPDGSHQKRDEDDSNPQGSLTESISWLISKKRQQLMEVARLKYQQSQNEKSKRRTDEGGQNRSSTSGTLNLTSDCKEKTSTTGVNRTELLPLPGSSTSLSTSSSSPSTPTSSCSLASVDDDDDVREEEEEEEDEGEDEDDDDSKNEEGDGDGEDGKEIVTKYKKSTNHHKRRLLLKGYGDSSCETSDRRKLLRKRRAQLIQGMSDTDSESEDGSCIIPHRKRTCMNSTDVEKPNSEMISIRHLGPKSSVQDMGRNKRISKERDKENGNESSSGINDKNNDRVHNVICVAVQNTNHLTPTEEHGETSGSASTPDSGIASQSFENGHPFNGRPSTSASDSSELMPPRFKRIRNRAEHSSRRPRRYRSVSQVISD